MSPLDQPDVCREILQSLLAGVCVVDMQKKIILWSDGAQHITGHARHEVLGRPCTSKGPLHCNQSAATDCNGECALARAIKMARPVETSGFLHHKSGYEIPVRIRAVPVRNPHGSIIGAVETFDTVEQAELSHQQEFIPGCDDPLTGVASQALMHSYLRESLGTFAEMHIPFGILRIRLQDLEQFRASYGADAAASLVRVVAQTLLNDLARRDFVGRWSDDEFLVILIGCREETVHIVRERLSRVLANDAIDWWGERRSLPVILGQAAAQANDTIETLLSRAGESLDSAAACSPRARAAADNDSSES